MMATSPNIVMQGIESWFAPTACCCRAREDDIDEKRAEPLRGVPVFGQHSPPPRGSLEEDDDLEARLASLVYLRLASSVHKFLSASSSAMCWWARFVRFCTRMPLSKYLYNTCAVCACSWRIHRANALVTKINRRDSKQGHFLESLFAFCR